MLLWFRRTAAGAPDVCRSVRGVAGPAWEGDDVADVVQTGGKQDEALKAQAKAWQESGVGTPDQYLWSVSVTQCL